MARILVADDNPSLRELMSEMLTAVGHEVVLASNGLEVMMRIQKDLPQLVLLDLQMPVLDGVVTLKQIRSDPRLARIPVVALTAFAMAGDQDKALGAGFDDYLPKPVGLAELKRCIDKHLGKR